MKTIVMGGLFLSVVLMAYLWYVSPQSTVGLTPVPAIGEGGETEIPEIYVAPVEERTVIPDTEADLVVTVVDEVVLEADNLSREEAQAQCEAVAYNTDHMFKQVVCVYQGEEIYNDIFIAG
jgi:hypothetical protein